MESSGGRPHDPEVPLGDAAIATEIATAAARGRGADRAPTLDQLLAAFGEPAPTAAARTRVANALRVAGMGVRPDIADAEPGQRLLLLPPGAGSRGSRGRALVGLVAVAAILAAAAAGATLLGDDNGDDRVADNLPAGTTTSSAAPATTSVPVATTETTATEPAATATAETTATTPTTTTTTASDDDEAAAKRKRAARLKREREAAAAAAAKKRTKGHTGVTVRVDASIRPTFLCVDNAHGTTMFSGTLTGKKVFRAKRIRMNIGLASTRVTVNGVAVRLDGSPTGFDITRKGGARSLPLGKRPCG